jgi:hypothetical protein
MPGGAFRTQAELIDETLGCLGALGLGQLADIESAAYVKSKVDPVLRMVAGLDICYIADPDNIPGALLMPLADILASECANRFGASSDDFAKLLQKGLGVPPGSGAAAMAIKQIMRGRPTYEPLKSIYF